MDKTVSVKIGTPCLSANIVKSQGVPIGVKTQLSERVSSLTRRSLSVNSNWKWFHQTQHNFMNKREFTKGIEVLRVLRKICLNPPKYHNIACNSAAIATLNVIFIMRGRVKLNKTHPTYLDYRLL